MADRHRIVLVGGIPVDTFVALSRRRFAAIHARLGDLIGKESA